MIELINRHTEAERHFIDKSFERVLKITNVPIEESSVDDLLAVIKLVITNGTWPFKSKANQSSKRS
jgi:hypothetical protein